MKETKKYWKGIEQLENSAEFAERSAKEFPEYLPVKSNPEGEPTRRDFLKLMGFSVAAASLAACEAPVRHAIPYVNKPVDLDPGVPNYYASTYVMGNDYCSVVVKTREGRPIKMEGNKLSKVSAGGTSSHVESSVLTLYDEQRYRNPKIAGKDADWKTIDERVMADLAANSGKIAVVSYSNFSPSTQKAINELSKFGQVDLIEYDPISFSGTLDAYESATGERFYPLFDYSKAKTFVSFGADFLGDFPNHPLVNRQFAKTRKLGDKKKEMSRLYSFEANLSITGANADYRQPIKPSEEVAYLLNLYNLLGGNVSAPAVKDSTILKKAARDLKASRGQSIVLSGSNDENIQQIVIAINDMLGNYGATIDTSKNVNLRKGSDKKFSQFISDLNAGQYGTTIFYNCNPLYDNSKATELKNALKKCKTTISTSDRLDETSSVVKYVAPDNHFLESWNDFEPVTGQYSFSQPTISPLFKTRQAQESFMKWAGVEKTYLDYLKDSWKSYATGSFTDYWNKCLHDGVVELPTESVAKTISVDVPAVASKLSTKKSSGLEVVLYANYSVGDGVQANNPWLQELPDPVTKACWDNYITVSPREATEKGWLVEGGDMKYKVATLTVGGKKITLPVLPQPGQKYGTVGVALGYGRTKAGKVGDGIGKNAYPLVDNKGNNLEYSLFGGKLDLTGEVTKVAHTQTSQTYSERANVVQETTLKEYQKNPQAGRYMPMISTPEGKKHPHAISLWKGHKYNNHHWGMMVDLNSCTGCGTCMVSCQTENNIPVVGKEEVINRREMHWLRIDRYYTSAPKTNENEGVLDEMKRLETASDNPEVVFQPMMCQQCNNAPCETVCPVAATTHSSEGLNMMTYNRCIGTRYCANNCPYKVRRFNWFKYHDNSKFADNTPMNNDLGKMVLNPDVTVRARGVMEKCTFCVQEIQAAKLRAKKAMKPLEDGDIKMACTTSCPSEAMVFGDMNNPNSKISKMLKIKQLEEGGVEAQEPRAFHVLEELRVMPNVWYLTKVRNRDAKQEKA